MSLTAAAALADPIIITAGIVVAPPAGQSSPPFGFGLIGGDTNLRGVTFDESNPFVNIGTDTNLSSQIHLTTLVFGPFEQQVQGQAYSDVVLNGMVNFSAGSVRITTDSHRFETPFTMSGTFSLFDFNPENRQTSDTPKFTAALTGRGIASIGYFGDEVGSGSFRSNGILYRFEAPATVSPEQATLTLLASGLAAIAMRAQRRRRAAHDDILHWKLTGSK